MVKYKLIKEYPGSPKKGDIRSQDWFKDKNYNPLYKPHYWERLREVIMVTEDGVEKRHFDDYYIVWHNVKTTKDTFPRTWLGAGCSIKLLEETFENNSDVKYFHSKSKAVEFVLDNTPMFSIAMLVTLGIESDMIEILRGEARVKI